MYPVFLFFRLHLPAVLAALALSCVPRAVAGPLDDIGVTALRALDPSLTGAGVNVALAEGSFGADPDNLNRPFFEVAGGFIGQPDSLFTYHSLFGIITGDPPPNVAGSESLHADFVGNHFFGAAGGVAPGVSRVDNYEANYFYTTVINPPGVKPPILAKVVNQSFIFVATGGGPLSAADQRVFDSKYDDYVAQYNTIIVSGAGNGGQVHAPSTAYNSIGVAVIDGSSSIGPTIDNGRSKPDITAPGGATSYSTPYVSGSAAVLVQAGTRGDGGGTPSMATDSRTVKALLLNGAVKPTDWTHTATAPLDPRYGAGVVNVYNSYMDLAGGQQVMGEATTLRGWDFSTVGPSFGNPNAEVTNHYYFTLAAGTPYQLTSTLVWNRQLGQTSINNLDLILLDRSTNTVVTGSFSAVDNVEHLYLSLTPGQYDLQVRKGSFGLTPTEQYALAFNFAAVPEPSTALLLAVAAGVVAGLTRRGHFYRCPRRL